MERSLKVSPKYTPVYEKLGKFVTLSVFKKSSELADVSEWILSEYAKS